MTPERLAEIDSELDAFGKSDEELRAVVARARAWFASLPDLDEELATLGTAAQEAALRARDAADIGRPEFIEFTTSVTRTPGEEPRSAPAASEPQQPASDSVMKQADELSPEDSTASEPQQPPSDSLMNMNEAPTDEPPPGDSTANPPQQPLSDSLMNMNEAPTDEPPPGDSMASEPQQPPSDSLMQQAAADEPSPEDSTASEPQQPPSGSVMNTNEAATDELLSENSTASTPAPAERATSTNALLGETPLADEAPHSPDVVGLSIDELFADTESSTPVAGESDFAHLFNDARGAERDAADGSDLADLFDDAPEPAGDSAHENGLSDLLDDDPLLASAGDDPHGEVRVGHGGGAAEDLGSLEEILESSWGTPSMAKAPSFRPPAVDLSPFGDESEEITASFSLAEVDAIEAASANPSPSRRPPPPTTLPPPSLRDTMPELELDEDDMLELDESDLEEDSDEHTPEEVPGGIFSRLLGRK